MIARNIYGLILSLFLLAACGGKNISNEEKLAGDKEKTWKTKRETTATGGVDRLSKEEKKERITFYKNGSMKMEDSDQSIIGQWSIEGNNLKLQFAGADVSENFTVLSIEEKEVKLQAGDGSQMTLKPE